LFHKNSLCLKNVSNKNKTMQEQQKTIQNLGKKTNQWLDFLSYILYAVFEKRAIINNGLYNI